MLIHIVVYFIYNCFNFVCYNQAPDYAAKHIPGTVNIPLGAEGGVNLSVEDGNFSIWVRLYSTIVITIYINILSGWDCRT